MNQFQLYRSKENRLYNKFSNANTLYWSDGSFEGEKIVEVKKVKNKEMILGINCDELTMRTSRGIYIYYYNSKYAIDPNNFKDHIFGNWYAYVKESKSIPLKIVMDTPEFKSTSIAIEVDESEVDITHFDLPNLPIKPISDFGN